MFKVRDKGLMIFHSRKIEGTLSIVISDVISEL